MTQQWVTFKIYADETLQCSMCFEYLHNQKVHFDVTCGVIEETFCEKCWKALQVEELKCKKEIIRNE